MLVVTDEAESEQSEESSKMQLIDEQMNNS